VQRGLEVIVESARAEARLVSDLLDIARYNTGDLEMKREDVELAPLVAECLDEARRAADKRGIVLGSAILTNGAVVGDPARLRQLTKNLLSNALKFTPKGGHVTLELAGDDGLVVLKVHDTGRGIAPSDLAHVFDPLRTGDPSMTRRESGMGLGLALVRAIAEKHGGHVRGESGGPGHGATFTVELPRTGAEEARA
jgi:signal transduction histidine kinase